MDKKYQVIVRTLDGNVVVWSSPIRAETAQELTEEFRSDVPIQIIDGESGEVYSFNPSSYKNLTISIVNAE